MQINYNNLNSHILPTEETLVWEEIDLTSALKQENNFSETAHKVIKYSLAIIDNGCEITAKGLEVIGQKELQPPVEATRLLVKSMIGLHAMAQGKFSLNPKFYLNSGTSNTAATVTNSYFWTSAMTTIGSKGIGLITEKCGVKAVSEAINKFVYPVLGGLCKEPLMAASYYASLMNAHELPEGTEEEKNHKHITINKCRLKFGVQTIKVATSLASIASVNLGSSLIATPLGILGTGAALAESYLIYSDMKKQLT